MDSNASPSARSWASSLRMASAGKPVHARICSMLRPQPPDSAPKQAKICAAGAWPCEAAATSSAPAGRDVGHSRGPLAVATEVAPEPPSAAAAAAVLSSGPCSAGSGRDGTSSDAPTPSLGAGMCTVLTACGGSTGQPNCCCAGAGTAVVGSARAEALSACATSFAEAGSVLRRFGAGSVTPSGSSSAFHALSCKSIHRFNSGLKRLRTSLRGRHSCNFSAATSGSAFQNKPVTHP
mmetsp:Transcript_29269/g.97235  ORF Transcript_29269/g.97235 Transcript_29269/m.97235 type:complete len:236 (+) Transcript_29269:1096-1803(+)